MSLDEHSVELIRKLESLEDDQMKITQTRHDAEYGIRVSAVVEPVVGGTFEDIELVERRLRSVADGTRWDFVGLQHDGEKHLAVYER